MANDLIPPPICKGMCQDGSGKMCGAIMVLCESGSLYYCPVEPKHYVVFSGKPAGAFISHMCKACGQDYVVTADDTGECPKCRAELPGCKISNAPTSGKFSAGELHKFGGFPVIESRIGESVALAADYLKMLDELPAFIVQKISGLTYHKDLKRGDATNDCIPEIVIAQLKARKSVYRARVSKELYQYGRTYGEAICAALQAHKAKGKESNEALPNPAPSPD